MWREDRTAYAEQIARCRAALHAGDSYELCLTTRFDADPGLRVDPLVLFHELAAHQPAPYAALLEHGTGARRSRTPRPPTRSPPTPRRAPRTS